eukprot:scaffold4127_cov124-Isochrysis_galbana.AAC.5
MSSMVQGKACGARAAAMLAHTVSLCVGMLRGLLERAKVLFAIVDLMLVNGTAFRQVCVACETHTGVFHIAAYSPRPLAKADPLHSAPGTPKQQQHWRT